MLKYIVPVWEAWPDKAYAVWNVQQKQQFWQLEFSTIGEDKLKDLLSPLQRPSYVPSSDGCLLKNGWPWLPLGNNMILLFGINMGCLNLFHSSSAGYLSRLHSTFKNDIFQHIG